jgi:hypothetical protein
MQYGTIKLENSTSVTMNVYVKDPAGEEHFVTTLGPGQVTVQFTPAGVTWLARPEGPDMKYIAEFESGHFNIEAEVEDEDDDLIDRGLGSTTS